MSTTLHTRSHQQRRLQLRGCLMILCVMIALTGCTMAQGESPPTPNSVPRTPTGTILPFTTLAQGAQLRLNQSLDPPKEFIITNTQEVDAALRHAAGDPLRLAISPQLIEQLRQIDYSRSFAILALQGGQGTSGYSITVNQVVQQGDRVLVLASLVRPEDRGDPAAHSAVETDPYHLIVIPKTGTWGQDVRFELVDKGKVVAETTHFIP
jgi:hypothetical protein